MRLWGYYAWHTFLNSLKKMFRSTVLVVILAVFGFGVIFGVAGAAIGSIVESQQEAEISSETVAEGNSDDGTDAGENDDVEADEYRVFEQAGELAECESLGGFVFGHDEAKV